MSNPFQVDTAERRIYEDLMDTFYSHAMDAFELLLAVNTVTARILAETANRTAWVSEREKQFLEAATAQAKAEVAEKLALVRPETVAAAMPKAEAAAVTLKDSDAKATSQAVPVVLQNIVKSRKR